MKKIIPLSLTLNSLLISQTITSIKYEGLLHLSSDVATEISGIHVGDEFDINKIDELKSSISRVISLIYWSQHQVEGI